MAPFVRALCRASLGERCPLWLERDDGLSIALAAESYLATPPFAADEAVALTRATGRICDAACAAGRHALFLQGQGRSVVAIDREPDLVALVAARGVANAICHDLLAGPPPRGPYDTILLLDNGLGVAGRRDRLPGLFENLLTALAPGGTILVNGSSLAGSPSHDDYFAGGRPRGEQSLRFRTRGEDGCLEVGPWFEWLQLDPQDLADLTRQCGLKATLLYEGEGRRYTMALCRRDATS